MNIDWTVQIENGNRVGNFTVKDAGGDNNATLLDGLVINVGFMLVYVITKQAMPKAGFLHPFGYGLLPADKPVIVKNADIGIRETTCLERFYCRVSMGAGIEDSYYCLISHVHSPVFTFVLPSLTLGLCRRADAGFTRLALLPRDDGLLITKFDFFLVAFG
jgi:hypothetical protein